MKAPIIALFLALVSCNKEPNVTITGNKSTAAVMEEVVLSIDATSDKKIKSLVVDAILYSDSGIHNTGRYYINDDKAKVINDQFTFLIPESFINLTIAPGDYYQFTVYTETGNNLTTTAWKVEVTP